MFNPLGILIIDDSPSDRELIEEGLTRSPEFECTSVGTIKEGLKALEANKYDVILLDLRLPDVFGDPLKALFEIQVMQPDRTVPVIVVSGYDDEDLAMQAIRGGAQDYFLKDNLIRSMSWLRGAILRSYMRNEHIRALLEKLTNCKGYNPGKGLEAIDKLKTQLYDIEQLEEGP